MITDNVARGRLRHVWFSTSTDLVLDAERDLGDLGNHLKVIDGCQALTKGGARGFGLSKDLQRGVLFSTYSTLISGAGGTSRLAQIIDWCGGASFDGCLVFDEVTRRYLVVRPSVRPSVSGSLLQQRLSVCLSVCRYT